MEIEYCYKCDVYYFTPKGEKRLDVCPFCSLAEIRYDNLDYIEKVMVLEMVCDGYI